MGSANVDFFKIRIQNDPDKQTPYLEDVSFEIPYICCTYVLIYCTATSSPTPYRWKEGGSVAAKIRDPVPF
jgi:hypothetical protein